MNSNKSLEKRLYEASNSSISIASKSKETFDYRDLKAIQSIDEIQSILYQYSTLASLEQLKVVDGTQKVMRDHLQEEYKNVVQLLATNSTSKDILFHSEVFQLKEGRHLKKGDRNKILIHEAFAKKNHLKLGDTMSLQTIDNRKGKYEIIGIFTGKKQETYTGFSSDFSENHVFVDYTSLNMHKVNQLFLYSKNSRDCDTIVKKLKKYTNAYEIKKDTDAYMNSLATIQNVTHILNIMIYSILIGGIVVLSLVLILWLRERIYEIGILLSIGMHKLEIMLQFILELFFISVPAIVLSLLLISLFVPFHLSCVFESYTILIGIILISIGWSCGMILVKKPKEILTKIS